MIIKPIVIALIFSTTAMLSWAQSNALPASGNVGIGTNAPTTLLELRKVAEAGAEKLLKISVSDASDDFLSIENATGVDGQFGPVIKGTKVSDNRFALMVLGSIGDGTMDNGNNAVVAFDARLNTGAVINRPLFVWQSYSTPYMTMLSDGRLGIGTTTPQAKLAVNGTILAKEVKVKTDISVPDYVFEPDYELPTLEEIETYVKEHKHLPEVPSAADVARDGLDLAEMNLLLLKKVEELTLHLIEKEKQLQESLVREQVRDKRIARLEQLMTN
ncbi:hypothetical protein [Parapedobacter sp. DT-150]|uniref:hypothetical protein n=1 Tax=Parapedobacter sp. DT-150 TaxID=3396162 RepID=UPI003F1A01DE